MRLGPSSSELDITPVVMRDVKIKARQDRVPRTGELLENNKQKHQMLSGYTVTVQRGWQ